MELQKGGSQPRSTTLRLSVEIHCFIVLGVYCLHVVLSRISLGRAFFGVWLYFGCCERPFSVLSVTNGLVISSRGVSWLIRYIGIELVGIQPK